MIQLPAGSYTPFTYTDEEDSMRNQDGFTFMGVMITMCIAWSIITLAALPSSNIFFRKDGVLKEIQKIDPNVVEILGIDRDYLDPSTILVRDNTGLQYTYYLDSNILFEYKLRK